MATTPLQRSLHQDTTPGPKRQSSLPESGSPVPDYDSEHVPARRSKSESSSDNDKRLSKKFPKVFAQIQSNIDELQSALSEPAPDYDTDSPRSGDFPPPPPPLTAEDLAQTVAMAHQSHLAHGDKVTADALPEAPAPDDGDTIKPKPLANPVLDSRERQALHKELLINQKMGKDVLKQSELSKVLKERKEVQKKKEWEEHKKEMDKSSLEYKLKERAEKLKEEEDKNIKKLHTISQLIHSLSK